MNITDCFLENGIKVTENVDTSKISSIKTGGCVRYGVYPESIGGLIKSVKICRLLDMKFKLIGGCTNTFFKDDSIDSAVIFTTKLEDNKICDGYARIDCGCSLSKILKSAADKNLEISNALFGIPGTVGGAMRNNAGAFDSEIGQTFIEGLFLNIETLEVVSLDRSDMMFGYRSSLLMKEPLVFLQGNFKTKSKERDLCVSDFKKYTKKRKATQPNLPSLGSFFKRSDGIIPAELIDKAGLKNYRINGAAISDKHAGFIVNLGNATSTDVDKLAGYVEERVKDLYNVTLQREAELVQ